MPSQFIRAKINRQDRVAVKYGPLVLAINSRYGTPIESTFLSMNETPELVFVPLDKNAWAPQVRFTLDGVIDGNRTAVTLVDCYGSISNKLADEQPEQWNHLINVNLNGTFYVFHAVLPLLMDSSSIVFVSSVSAHTGAPHHAHYAAVKAGLVNFAKSTARALAPRVRVNCLAPGMTLTDMGEQTAAHLPQNYAEEKLSSHRFDSPKEIAQWIVFLASPINSFVYGATFNIDGGRALR